MAPQSEERPDRGGLVATGSAKTDSSTDTAAADPTPDRPSAAFRYAPSAPVAGSPTLFEVESHERGYQYEWDFGDDGGASGRKASNVYDAAGRREVRLTVTDDDGVTETVSETVTVYREVEAERRAAESDELVSVVIRGDSDVAPDEDVASDEDARFDPTEDVAVASLRFGAPTALAMGSGAAPVRSEARDGDLRVWFRAGRTGRRDGDEVGRLAGQTVDGRPVAATVETN